MEWCCKCYDMSVEMQNKIAERDRETKLCRCFRVMGHEATSGPGSRRSSLVLAQEGKESWALGVVEVLMQSFECEGEKTNPRWSERKDTGQSTRCAGIGRWLCYGYHGGVTLVLDVERAGMLSE